MKRHFFIPSRAAHSIRFHWHERSQFVTRREIFKNFSWKCSKLGWWCKPAQSMSARHWSNAEPKLNREFKQRNLFMAASFQCFTFFSRKRPASTASKTNFCSKLQASVGFSHIYQRVCLFTAISSKKIRKSFVIEAKIYCLHAFEQWTHSHGFNCTHILAAVSKLTKFWSWVRRKFSQPAQARSRNVCQLWVLLFESEKRQPPCEHRLTTSKRFCCPEKKRKINVRCIAPFPLQLISAGTNFLEPFIIKFPF